MTAYEEFRAEHIARHEQRATSVLSIAGEVLMIGAIPTGLLRRSVKTAGAVLGVGFAIAAAAHLFQPGTVKDELAAIARHPLWATRAETDRILALRRPHITS